MYGFVTCGAVTLPQSGSPTNMKSPASPLRTPRVTGEGEMSGALLTADIGNERNPFYPVGPYGRPGKSCLIQDEPGEERFLIKIEPGV